MQIKSQLRAKINLQHHQPESTIHQFTYLQTHEKKIHMKTRRILYREENKGLYLMTEHRPLLVMSRTKELMGHA